MDKRIIGFLKSFYLKLASITIKAEQGDLTLGQLRELTDALFQNTASEIHRHRVSSFVTDN